MSTTIDESDQQKRERIEKYKEQRRSKLRAQYKPENYRSSSQSSLESQSAEESSIPTSRKRKVCICWTFLELPDLRNSPYNSEFIDLLALPDLLHFIEYATLRTFSN